MLHKIIVGVVGIGLLSACKSEREEKLEANRFAVAAKVKLGDDIFEAKELLEAEGFTITYGPGFPTENKTYLLMIVDYGLDPTTTETVRYVVGLEGSDQLIDGAIRATPEGEITSIE